MGEEEDFLNSRRITLPENPFLLGCIIKLDLSETSNQAPWIAKQQFFG